MKQNKKTQSTNPGWGVVACIGAMVAVTMGDSIIMAGIGTALLLVGAWLGGYMTGDARLKDAANETAQTINTERRAA